MAYMADIGQEEDFEAAKTKALKIGAKRVFVEDLRREFIDETITPAIQANLLYEGVYLLGTALARPIIAKRQIELALEHGCDYVSHGCTGKGNDQVRFELAFYALNPSIKVVAPWRQPEFYQRFQGRSDLLRYAEEKGVPVTQTRAKPWSTDENMFHISYEAGILEDPGTQPPSDMWKLTRNFDVASPDGPLKLTLHFDTGRLVKLEGGKGGERTDPLEMFQFMNEVGRLHGIGRVDIVENRFIGIKSRGCYETPAGTILLIAHRDLEGLTMDREVRRIRDDLSRRLSEIVYNGMWYSPERDYIQNSIEYSQRNVMGQVTVELYKGNVTVCSRSSPIGLYDPELSSMDVEGGFNPSDSSGFIHIQAIRLRAYQNLKLKQSKN
jgi:argininosuccinate synthase